jgi:hypothetical protein
MPRRNRSSDADDGLSAMRAAYARAAVAAAFL